MTEQMNATVQRAGQVATEGKNAAAETAGDVKDRVIETAEAGRQAVGDVASTAAEQAQQVASETARQARDLMGEARGQLQDQAAQQHRKVVDGLRSLTSQLDAMASTDGADGVARELVVQARDRASGVADWLDGREPGDLLQEVRTFARQRPGSFLISAALAGVVAGRLTRGVAARHGGGSAGSSPTGPAQAAALGTPPPALPAAQDTQATQVLPATDPVISPVGYQPTTPRSAPPAPGGYGGPAPGGFGGPATGGNGGPASGGFGGSFPGAGQ
jgi:hypothetical protein